MKKTMLIAGVILLPFLNQQVNAQNSDLATDTLTIKLKGNNQILIVGQTYAQLKSYEEKADEVKTSFAIDISKAYSTNALTKTETQVHYFYNNASQRRIKAEQAEYSDRGVDIEYEIKRIQLNLPKHRYTVHDIGNNQTWEIYVSNPDSLLNQLGEISLKEAIQKALSEPKILRKQTNTIVSTDSSSYGISGKKAERLNTFEAAPFMGASIIGNRISPALGLTYSFVKRNKYNIPIYKIGLTQTMLHLVDGSSTEFRNANLLFSNDLFYVRNYNFRSKDNYLGIGAQVGTILNSYKFGFLLEGVGRTNWSFDLIYPTNRSPIYPTKPFLFSLTTRIYL